MLLFLRNSKFKSASLKLASPRQDEGTMNAHRWIFASLTGFVIAFTTVDAHAVRGACRGRSLPSNQSLNARDIQLVCGGGVSTFTRTPIPYDHKAWSREEKKRRRDKMQEMRLAEPKIEWSGTIDYSTYETWTYTEYVTEANALHCGTTRIHKTCSRPKYKTVCVEDPPPTTSTYSSSKSSYTPSSSRSDSGTGWSRGPSLPSKDYDMDDSRAPDGCSQVHDGYENYDCSYDEPNICPVPYTRQGVRECSQEQMTYNVQFAKPPASYAPGKDASYMDILPNKYDLLPGEWEKIHFISNEGRDGAITPRLDFENAWNQYSYSVSTQEFRCEAFAPKKHVDVVIRTNGRIKRKAPNAFAIPVDRYGRKRGDNGISREEIGLKDGLALGEPYKIELTDTANAVVTAAARTSRRFNVDNAKAEVVARRGEIGNAMNMGFWKDTQFRVRLFQINKNGRPVWLTQALYTNSGTVSSIGNNVVIPLQGEGGVAALYRANGPFNSMLGDLWSRYRIKLEPGQNYELRLAMYQKGLPFYETGCSKNNNCEGEKAIDSMFSDELEISFKTDERIDERTVFQKFLDWQRKPLSEKLGF